MTENDKVVLDSLFKSENINHKKNDTFYFRKKIVRFKHRIRKENICQIKIN